MSYWCRCEREPVNGATQGSPEPRVVAGPAQIFGSDRRLAILPAHFRGTLMIKPIALYVSGLLLGSLLAGCANMSGPEAKHHPLTCNCCDFGAKGDGKTLDSGAINKAIEVASAAGGGTVYFPPGTYLCYSIRLKSNICLYLDQ